MWSTDKTSHIQTSAHDSTSTLLVVDDDPVQRRVIGKIGRQAGFSVYDAPSVLEAAQLLRTRKFDCATIDLSLGDQSGLELLATIANVSPETPVFIVSGRAQDTLEASRHFAAEFGLSVRGVFSKPINLADLRGSLARVADDLLCARA